MNSPPNGNKKRFAANKGRAQWLEGGTLKNFEHFRTSLWNFYVCDRRHEMEKGIKTGFMCALFSWKIKTEKQNSQSFRRTHTQPFLGIGCIFMKSYRKQYFSYFSTELHMSLTSTVFLVNYIPFQACEKDENTDCSDKSAACRQLQWIGNCSVKRTNAENACVQSVKMYRSRIRCLLIRMATQTFVWFQMPLFNKDGIRSHTFRVEAIVSLLNKRTMC